MVVQELTVEVERSIKCVTSVTMGNDEIVSGMSDIVNKVFSFTGPSLELLTVCGRCGVEWDVGVPVLVNNGCKWLVQIPRGTPQDNKQQVRHGNSKLNVCKQPDVNQMEVEVEGRVRVVVWEAARWYRLTRV
eukprot:4858836-Amphidinium_carterae.1